MPVRFADALIGGGGQRRTEEHPMRGIGKVGPWLERHSSHFTVEALAKELDPAWVDEALRVCGRETVRERDLPAEFTVWLVILLGLYRKLSYVNVLEKLRDTWWCRERWREERVPRSTSVSEARDRVGAEVLGCLFERAAERWAATTRGLVKWGRRVLAVDGTTYKVQDTPRNARHWKRPKASRGRSGYPQIRAVHLVDVGTRLVLGLALGPYLSGEVTLARRLVAGLRAGTLVLLDRNFQAYDLLWDIRQRRADFIVRVKRNARCRVLKVFGRGDRLIEVDLPRYYRRKRPDLPRTWKLREITYRPKGSGETIRIWTSLLNPRAYPKEELAELYHGRWGVETATDEVKTHLSEAATVSRPPHLRSKTPERVRQELYGMLLAYNVVRLLMVRAAGPAKLEPCRLSFVACLERVREAVREMMWMETERLPARYRRLLGALLRIIVPLRPSRKYPRAVKVKMSGYPLKRRRKSA
jgi:hypothetical protein